MSASDSELALLAAIIQCEAGGESNTGKVAVGAVIMNRVRSMVEKVHPGKSLQRRCGLCNLDESADMGSFRSSGWIL